MSLSQSTALSLARKKDLVLEAEHHLQKASSHDLMIRQKRNYSGQAEKYLLNNKDSP